MRKKLALAVLTGLLAASLTGCMPSAAPSSAAGAAAQTEKQGQPSETGGKEGTSEESEGEATIRMNLKNCIPISMWSRNMKPTAGTRKRLRWL